MDLYASRMSEQTLKVPLFHNMDNDIHQVMSFCHGHLRSLVAIYVERFDYEKAKTVLRAINGGASDEMIEDQILPPENTRNSPWLAIVRSTEGLQEAVDAMSGTPWGRTLSKLEGDLTLEEMENALDMQYFSDAIKAVKSGKGEPRLLRYLRMEIDHRNIINQLRAIRLETSQEKRSSIVIPGGRIDNSVMKQACLATNDSDLLEALGRSSSFDATGFEEAMRKSSPGDLGSIRRVVISSEAFTSEEFSHLSPISPFPVIHYIECKALEIRNLRLLVEGRQSVFQTMLLRLTWTIEVKEMEIAVVGLSSSH